jgi:hypothetical protein
MIGEQTVMRVGFDAGAVKYSWNYRRDVDVVKLGMCMCERLRGQYAPQGDCYSSGRGR